MTPVICPTPVERYDSGRMRDSGRMPDFGWKMRLRSEDVTPVLCPTSVKRYDSGCISRLFSHFSTPVDVTTPFVSPDSGRASRLRSMSVLHVLPPQL
jgi:hypothetical protein